MHFNLPSRSSLNISILVVHRLRLSNCIWILSFTLNYCQRKFLKNKKKTYLDAQLWLSNQMLWQMFNWYKLYGITSHLEETSRKILMNASFWEMKTELWSFHCYDLSVVQFEKWFSCILIWPQFDVMNESLFLMRLPLWRHVIALIDSSISKFYFKILFPNKFLFIGK